MLLRIVLIGTTIFFVGCASVVLPTVSEDLKKRATVLELPEFMKEYAASGVYLRQRLEANERGWLLVPGFGVGVGVNLIAIDYGPRGYNYEPSDDIVRVGLFDALTEFCSQRSGRVESNGSLPLGHRVFVVTRDNGRLCIGNDGKMIGAIVYGRVTRDVRKSSWRPLEYNVLSAKQVAALEADTAPIRKEARERRQKTAAETRLHEAAIGMNRRKMDALNDPAHQNAYTAWRQQIKEGEACWVGPRRTTEKMMLHAMIIERKGSIVRVQFDGKTNAGFLIKLPSNEEWVKLTEVFPDKEFDVVMGGGIVTPNVQPQ